MNEFMFKQQDWQKVTDLQSWIKTEMNSMLADMLIR